ncbi:hypothetical protein OEV98_13900 [Caldibacillus lycopersici]|uniref:Uncharacterized protein n=1 Tax=Perspicuibacillus lycopersici TaxID=1325689 RepID=A0AAE3IU34_9BACI|nr:hypothetical protein [Perspicuibacillus lycopersici]MCU9614633.1 hypothetical protein [Perspicuibacillus lycopersici]
MNNRIKISFFFFSIAAFLLATKHITAAIISSNINTERVNYYEGSYDIVGWGITAWTMLSFIIGLIFFIHGIWVAYIVQNMQHNKQ